MCVCIAAAATCPAMGGRKGDVPCPALFDLSDVQLQQVVKPCDQLLSVEGSISMCYW